MHLCRACPGSLWSLVQRSAQTRKLPGVLYFVEMTPCCCKSWTTCVRQRHNCVQIPGDVVGSEHRIVNCLFRRFDDRLKYGDMLSLLSNCFGRSNCALGSMRTSGEFENAIT